MFQGPKLTVFGRVYIFAPNPISRDDLIVQLYQLIKYIRLLHLLTGTGYEMFFLPLNTRPPMSFFTRNVFVPPTVTDLNVLDGPTMSGEANQAKKNIYSSLGQGEICVSLESSN